MHTGVSGLLSLAAITVTGADIVGGVLLALALALFVAEFFAPTHGSVAVGGLVILVVGLIVLAQGTGSAVPVVLIVALALALDRLRGAGRLRGRHGAPSPGDDGRERPGK